MGSSIESTNKSVRPDANTFRQKRNSNCCKKRVITAPLDFAGTYVFKEDVDDEKDKNCVDGYIYVKDDEPGNEYCFKAVTSNAATFNDECDILTPKPETTTRNPDTGTPVNLINIFPPRSEPECTKPPVGV